MFFILFVASAISTREQCPPGTEYFFNQVFEKEIPSDGWYYFYTTHQLRDTPLNYAIKSDNPITLFINHHSTCPDENDEPHAVILGGDQLTRVSIPVESDIKLVVNGIKGPPGTKFTIGLEGQQTTKKRFHPGLKLFLIFIVMFTIAISFFLFCVVPPKKEKLKYY